MPELMALKLLALARKGASDFKHKSTYRKDRYIARHKKNEDHGLSGVKTAGLWSANLLWNTPTLKQVLMNLIRNLKSLNVKVK